jgi:predicted ATP-grasp superfamily ATP-dependent carboligase
MEFGKRIGVERVLTFAAMATEMHPERTSRVFCTATTDDLLKEMLIKDMEMLTEGRISGLNGVLLAVAAEVGVPGACLLGEMPHIFSHLPFPAASLAVLQAFLEIARIDLDMSELTKQAEMMNRKLGELLAQVEDSLQQPEAVEEEFAEPSGTEEGLSDADRMRVERLFEDAQLHRSKAFELKQVLDQLGVFKEFEDRFLDLFKKGE